MCQAYQGQIQKFHHEVTQRHCSEVKYAKTPASCEHFHWLQAFFPLMWMWKHLYNQKAKIEMYLANYIF